MMGQLGSGQDKLFYSFNLDNHVPREHLLRGVDHFLDLRDLRQHLAPFYSPMGRASIDPELMIRMLIVGYCSGIRSERRLCEEVHLNLACRWFCRLGLEDAVPEHSTFSKNRHGRFRDSDVLRHVFESVLCRCMSEGLVKGEGFAIDASIIRADASSAHGVPGSDPVDWGCVKRQSRAVREYLEELEVANPAGTEAANTTETLTQPKRISLTDPAAHWTAAKGSPAFFAYSTNCLIDLQAGIIVDVEATPANRSHEVESTRTMIDRVERRRDLKPRRRAGDTAYGSAAMLARMIEEKEIAPHVPVWDKTTRKDNTLFSSEFLWDELANEYRCLTGHTLRSDRRKFRNPRSRVTNADTIIYRASQFDCESCSMKDRCCPNAPFRKIARSIHEAVRDETRRIAKTPEYKRSCRERKKVEILFAHLKRILKLDRLRLRGPSGARDEFPMAATAQNLRRMAKRFTPETKQMNQAVA
ncbi:transposase [Paraburkholderia ginsengiterrae]|uniref:Transposase n=1 Tax=Paraburkholderia ginsengiterrae TaxID=1462993 RepID=A0A1A9MYQ4_9BURK|nr:IS1182 family transposase [Paraburkholderia ginsengiterrae]OAJ52844.1 transposase [Paraburkholderia ginsengiterrae]OAJ54137.1 transposase [Paraburkholderia ginsengiterrae]